MKISLLFLLLLTQIFSATVEKELRINGQQFIFAESDYDMYGDKGVTLVIYKEKKSRKNELFSFVLENKSGNCSDRAVQEGSYEVEGNHIVFYSHWRRQGKAYSSPQGDRKMVYEVGTDASLKKISSILYIERERKKYNPDSGMKYLFTLAKTKAEKEALAQYIAKVERIFEGTFIYGKEAKALNAEVYSALARKHKNMWK